MRCVSDEFIHNELMLLALSASIKDRQYIVKTFSSTYQLYFYGTFETLAQG